MKKIFTLFAAVLMAASMMAKDVTFGNTEAMAAGNSNPMSMTKDGVTLTVSWTSSIQKSSAFSWMSRVSAGSVTVSVTAPGETITNFAIQGGDISYSGTDTTYTFNLGKMENKYFNRVVVTLEDAAEPEGTPSVTEFSSLDDLDAMTITFTGVELELDSYWAEDGFVLLMDTTNMEELGDPTTYAEASSFSFSNNVLTITSFVSASSLPEEEKDLLIFIGDVFKTYADVFVSVHYIPVPTALENNAVEMKATKLVENGQMIILRDGKKFNLVGAEL